MSSPQMTRMFGFFFAAVCAVAGTATSIRQAARKAVKSFIDGFPFVRSRKAEHHAVPSFFDARRVEGTGVPAY